MADDSATNRDLIEQVAESFVIRFRAGERPSIEEFARRYPELADELRELLPALVLLEQNASLDDTAAHGAPSKVAAPHEIGDFSIVREIGRGGMGVVYEAVQQSLGRHVALKVLSTPSLLNPTHLERFRLEARAAARLHHTHIVPVFGVGEHGGLHYYAMQFIQGQSLDLVVDAIRELRRRELPHATVSGGDTLSRAVADGLLTGCFGAEDNGSAHQIPRVGDAAASSSAGNAADRLPQASIGLSHSEFTSSHGGREYYHSVARVAMQVAEALAYAHSQGILHRDIKPSNLLLDAKGNVWVTDFGLAKSEGTDGLTQTGDFVGTLRYMAPERLEGWSDRRSDLYSLGATLYELLTLRPFLECGSRGQLVDKILHENPPPPSKRDRQIPRDLETIVLKAIAKDPTARYRTAEEMAEDLRLFLADRPVRARRSTAVEQVVRWCRRNPAVAGLIVTVAASLVAGTGISSYFAASASRQARAAVSALDEAERQRHRAELVNQFFMNEVFGQADPNVYKRAGISLVQALDTASASIDTKFPNDPELRAMLQARLGEIYSAMDEQVKAVAQLQSAAALWGRVGGASDPRTLACRSHLGNSMNRSGRHREAKVLLTSTLAEQQKVLGPSHLDTLRTAIYLGYCLLQLKDDNDIQHLEQTYKQALTVLGPRDPTTFEAEYSYSWGLRWRGRSDEALDHARIALAGLRDTVGGDDIRTMYASYNYASCLQEHQQYDEALKELRSLFDVRKRVLGAAHTDTFWAGLRLSTALDGVGKHSEAKVLRKELFLHLRTEKLVLNADVLNGIAWMWVISVDPELRDGKGAIEMATKACKLTNYQEIVFVDTLAAAYAECGDREKTLKWSKEILTLPRGTVEIQYWNALRLLWCGSAEEYRRACAAMTKQFETSTNDNVRFWLAWTCALSPGAIDALSLPTKFAEEIVKNQPTNASYLDALGILEYRSENFEQAAKQLTAAIVTYQEDKSFNSSPLYSQFFLAMAKWQLGHNDDARQLLREAQAGMDAEMKSPPAWNRRATLELFRREAESLIQPAEVSSSEAPSR